MEESNENCDIWLFWKWQINISRFFREQHQLPVLHLDTVQFIENWQERNRQEALQMVATFMEQDSWVIDGNYSKFYQERRLEEADHVILLLFSPFASLKRIIERRVKYRNTARPDMAEGCPEKIDGEFLWWVLYKGRNKAKRQHYQAIQKQYPEKVIVIKNQQQLTRFYQQQHMKLR